MVAPTVRSKATRSSLAARASSAATVRPAVKATGSAVWALTSREVGSDFASPGPSMRMAPNYRQRSPRASGTQARPVVTERSASPVALVRAALPATKVEALALRTTGVGRTTRRA